MTSRVHLICNRFVVNGLERKSYMRGVNLATLALFREILGDFMIPCLPVHSYIAVTPLVFPVAVRPFESYNSLCLILFSLSHITQ